MGAFNTVAGMTIALLNDSNITISVALHSVHDFNENIKGAMEVVTSVKELNASVQAEANTIGGHEDGVARLISYTKKFNSWFEYTNGITWWFWNSKRSGKNVTNLRISYLNVNTELQRVFAIAIDEYVTEGEVSEDKGLDPRKTVKPEVEAIKLEVKGMYSITNTKEVIKLQTNCLVIAIGNDHTAYELKQTIIKFLHLEGYRFLNLGTHNSDPVDCHNVGFDVDNAIVNEKANSVIVVCGTGISITITANPINGVRCVLCYEEGAIRLPRLRYVSNVLALGARIIPSYEPVELVKIFLNIKTSGERDMN
uniref:Ribose-5-phosphate isomerase B n=1 Tax=Eufriesea mexicana TaxID=516756 RepID=A0A310S9U7_9HYME